MKSVVQALSTVRKCKRYLHQLLEGSRLYGVVIVRLLATREQMMGNEVIRVFNKFVDWMDGHGKLAWIALMVLAFIFFWPIGLIILFFLIWSNRMGRFSKFKGCREGLSTTKNEVFEKYKEDTLSRLREEQRDFAVFLDNLKRAKDQAEFDQFMDQRKAGST